MNTKHNTEETKNTVKIKIIIIRRRRIQYSNKNLYEIYEYEFL
jgi:hypothetical protein